MRAFIVSLCLLVGCSSNDEKSSVESFRNKAEAISTAAEQHRTHMQAVTSMEACQAEMSRYRDEMRPLVEQMREMSADMASCSGMMGADGGDMRAMCDAMMSDLDRHLAEGCASTDMSANQLEASRHSGRMMDMASRESQMSGMMGNGSMMCGG